MKIRVDLTIDEELFKLAKEKRINLSGTFNHLLREYFKLDKILEEKKLEQEIIKLQQIQKENEEYEKAKLKRNIHLFEELNKNEKWLKFMETYNKDTSPEELMAIAKEMKSEGFPVGFMEIKRVLEANEKEA